MNTSDKNHKQGIVPKRTGLTSLLGLPLLSFILCLVLTMTWFIRFPTFIKGKGTVLDHETRRDSLYLIGSFNKEDLPQIRSGQTVWLVFKKYPPGTWGRISGLVQDIIPDSSIKGNVKVRLQHGLLTDKKKLVPFESGLNGDVFVVVKNISLLEKIF